MNSGSTIRQEIEAAVQRFVMLANAGSLEAFADLYTEDALIMLPGLAAVNGRHGAVIFGERIRSRRPARLVLATQEVEGSGDGAWERGTSEWVQPDGEVADRGKYIVIWKRTESGWKLHRDIMNSDVRSARG
jgi:ketosteroid isomerase-like protein